MGQQPWQRRARFSPSILSAALAVYGAEAARCLRCARLGRCHCPPRGLGCHPVDAGTDRELNQSGDARHGG